MAACCSIRVSISCILFLFRFLLKLCIHCVFSVRTTYIVCAFSAHNIHCVCFQCAQHTLCVLSVRTTYIVCAFSAHNIHRQHSITSYSSNTPQSNVEVKIRERACSTCGGPYPLTVCASKQGTQDPFLPAGDHTLSLCASKLGIHTPFLPAGDRILSLCVHQHRVHITLSTCR